MIKSLKLENKQKLLELASLKYKLLEFSKKKIPKS